MSLWRNYEQVYKDLYVGRDATDRMLTIDGGDLYVSGIIYLGRENTRTGSFGKLLQQSGSVDANELRIGVGSDISGEYELLSGSLNIRNMGYLAFSGGTAAMYQKGGTADLKSISVGYTGDATYELSGGSLTVHGNHFIGHVVGDSTFGKFIQSGGVHSSKNLYVGYTVESEYELSDGLLKNSNEIDIGGGSGANGKFLQTGGTIDAQTIRVGNSGQGTFTQMDGVVKTVTTTNEEYMVNSIRITDASAAATINGALLALDRGDVPGGLLKPISVWEFDGADTAVNVMIRYDAEAVREAKAEDSHLRVFQYVDGTWLARPSSIDTDKKTIAAALEAPLGMFAVASTAPATRIIIR